MPTEITIRLDMDGFRATFDPEDWPPRSEYLVVETDHDEQDQPINIDVWEGVDFFQTMEHPQ